MDALCLEPLVAKLGRCALSLPVTLLGMWGGRSIVAGSASFDITRHAAQSEA